MIPVGALAPAVNVAAVPDEIQNSLVGGLQTGQMISDGVLLRPKQVAAAGAVANATTAQAQNAQQAAVADRSNIPLRAQLAGTQLNVGQTDAENALTLAALKKTVVASPDFAKEFTAQLTNAAHESNIQSQTSLQRSTGELGRVPDEQSALDQNVNTALIRAQGQNNRTPAEQQVLDNTAINARDQSDIDTAAQHNFAVTDARYDTAVANAVAGAGQAKVTAAPYANPNVQAGLEQGAQAGAVGQALSAKANLVRLLASIGSGSGAIPLDADTQNKIITAAAAKGVNVINRPIQQISAEYAQKVALEDAAPVLKQIDETSDAAQTSLSSLQQIDKLGKVSTGALYTLPGVETIDRTLAQFGLQGPQQRELYRALNQRLVPLVRQPGSVSNFEQNLYTKSLPGVGVSPATNVAMVAGLLSIGQRNTQRPGFYRALIGKLPVGDVQQIWDGYVNANPAILDQNTVNKNALTPQQYLGFLTAAPGQADQQVRDLAARQDLASLPVVTDAASQAAAPDYAPFVASPNANGQMVATPNAKYWAPIIDAQKKVQSAGIPTGSSMSPSDFQTLFATPAADFLRPAGTVITPNASAVPSISLLKPR